MTYAFVWVAALLLPAGLVAIIKSHDASGLLLILSAGAFLAATFIWVDYATLGFLLLAAYFWNDYRLRRQRYNAKNP